MPSTSIFPNRVAPSLPGPALSQPWLAPRGRYFEDGVGRTFIPIGLNLCFPRHDRIEEDGISRYETWISRLAAEGGNFIRLWLGHSFFDPEPGCAGEFSESRARRLDRVLALALAHDVRVKITLEHFRSIIAHREQEIFPGAATFAKPVYSLSNGGFASDMEAFLAQPECRRRYLLKLDWLAERYAQHPAIFGWELWNEMNAVRAPGWLEWSEFMLPELRLRFPRHLVMQSLGSYDRDTQRPKYAAYAKLEPADLVQAHRYLDPGAGFDVCRGPMDELCADAVSELRKMAPDKPVLLAECGAVEKDHTAPSHLYEADVEGLLLHDMLFAPFFAGAAGPGHAWHWDFYVERHDLWWHFGRFARAIRDFDPLAEKAQPFSWQTPQLRVYGLRGRQSSLLWLRDAASPWQAELKEGKPAREIIDGVLSLPSEMQTRREVRIYDPWKNTATLSFVKDGLVSLPSFTRSLVVRLDEDSRPGH